MELIGVLVYAGVSRFVRLAPVRVTLAILVCWFMCMLTLLGNIAIRTGRKLQWDPSAEKIVGDESAAAMQSRPYRDPWKLPVV